MNWWWDERLGFCMLRGSLFTLLYGCSHFGHKVFLRPVPVICLFAEDQFPHPSPHLFCIGANFSFPCFLLGKKWWKIEWKKRREEYRDLSFSFLPYSCFMVPFYSGILSSGCCFQSKCNPEGSQHKSKTSSWRRAKKNKPQRETWSICARSLHTFGLFLMWDNK